MDERQKLTVPDLVGQPVHIAQEMAANIGFGLAAGDPDGPGLRSRTWARAVLGNLPRSVRWVGP
jgi:hypothetical protein